VLTLPPERFLDRKFHFILNSGAAQNPTEESGGATRLNARNARRHEETAMNMRYVSAAAAIGAAFAVAAWAQEKRQENEDQTARETRAAQPLKAGDDFAMPRRWQKATDLIGKPVKNAANEDLGKIEEIVVDANSGRILYGVLSFGGFLGMGDKLFAVPWQSFALPDDANAFVLDVSTDRLKNAEGFDQSQWPDFADEAWAVKTYKHYEQTPYWQRDGARADGQAAGSYRDRWRQRVTVWQKASDLYRKPVRNPQNEDLGRMSDLAIDPDAGRILYGVLSYGGKLFAIPYNALTLSSDAKHFSLNVTRDDLNDTVGFVNNAWPNMTDSAWAIRLHEHYRIQPYWVEVRRDGGKQDDRKR
jgi:sporulation protein YlmC with PRC-barrel domain